MERFPVKIKYQNKQAKSHDAEAKGIFLRIDPNFFEKIPSTEDFNHIPKNNHCRNGITDGIIKASDAKEIHE
jgi:hypothetical protein